MESHKSLIMVMKHLWGWRSIATELRSLIAINMQISELISSKRGALLSPLEKTKQKEEEGDQRNWE